MRHVRGGGFAGAGGGYAIYGNAFTLTSRLAATNTTGANVINNNITLSTVDIPVDVASASSLSLNGQLSGTVGVTWASASITAPATPGARALSIAGARIPAFAGPGNAAAARCRRPR